MGESSEDIFPEPVLRPLAFPPMLCSPRSNGDTGVCKLDKTFLKGLKGIYSMIPVTPLPFSMNTRSLALFFPAKTCDSYNAITNATAYITVSYTYLLPYTSFVAYSVWCERGFRPLKDFKHFIAIAVIII